MWLVYKAYTKAPGVKGSRSFHYISLYLGQLMVGEILNNNLLLYLFGICTIRAEENVIQTVSPRRKSLIIN